MGCTPAFNLEQRVRLRDVCQSAELMVGMANLIEEPVAAAFEVVRTGAARDGRTIEFVDVGGGTLDVSVLEVRHDGTDFTIYSTGGIALAGDRYTECIVEHLETELARRSTGGACGVGPHPPGSHRAVEPS